MCRFVDAGSAVLRLAKRPLVWVALATWVGIAVGLHLLLPVRPVHRYDVTAAFDGLALDIGLPQSKAAAISPAGDVVTVISNHSPIIPPGPKIVSFDQVVCFWDVLRGELKGEIRTLGRQIHPLETQPVDPTWFALSIRDGNTTWVEIFDTRTFKLAHTIPSSDVVFSSSGNQVAYGNDKLQFLDLSTGAMRVLADAPLAPRCFSKDDLLLACTNDNQVLIVDVAKGAIVATLPVSEAQSAWARRIEFAPDGKAIAWEFNRTVAVTDFADKERFVIKKAQLIGWQTSDLVLTAEEESRVFRETTSYLELWDWRQQRNVARWDAPGDERFVVAHMKSWVEMPEIFITRSRDGKHVLFAGYVADRPSTWMAKLREWLNLPNERRLHLEVFLLDGETLALRDRWPIPAEYHRDGILQFTADGQSIVYTDGHVVEHYAVPPRSWLSSFLWAAAGPAALILLATVWRICRRRKTSKTAPTAAPE